MNIYEREFSASGSAANHDGPLVMPINESAMCFEIGFPPEGDITKLIVQQAADGATLVAFKVNLYDRQVCSIGPLSSESEAADDMTTNIAKIMPTQPVGAWQGAGTELFVNDKEYSYRNREGTWTVPVRKIYLEIVVQDASEETTWEVAIAARIGGALT
jgi:hypothetical protein